MSKINCYHCGTDCDSVKIEFDQKLFCCNGCKTVFEILNHHELTSYYDLEQSPGSIPNEIDGKYDYLDNEEITNKINEFNDGHTAVVNFNVPTIHCSSCIWVLENLSKLNSGIKVSLVNFPRKQVRVTYKMEQISLREVVEMMSSIGYEPYISLDDFESSKSKTDRKLIYQVAVAGFAFGNVMLLSFPEYFEMDEYWLNRFKPFFRGLMLLFSIPAVFYSAKDYLISAYKGLKHGFLNIDVPIALGILVLLFRSVFEILTDTGQGFFDSLTGLIFFLLLGKIFQRKTYNFMSFERDYKSYFPIAITKINKDKSHISIPVHQVKKGDRLLIRNEEIIPVDGVLILGNAQLDYSFVTGESMPISKESGDQLFAGGKQKGSSFEMEVLQTVTQSYLTQLWSNDVFQNDSSKNIKNLTDSISKHFTLIILSIALLAGIYWFYIDRSLAFQVVSAILIVACPCALALSAPFALGNMIRIFGNEKFYLKNASIIESIAKIDHIVFDKTGTITSNLNSKIKYQGEPLNEAEKIQIKTLLKASNHPLSRMLYDFLQATEIDEIKNFNEVPGQGLEGTIQNNLIRLGSAKFVEYNDVTSTETSIFIQINQSVKGKYVFHNSYRKDLSKVFNSLLMKFDISILSGDNEGEKQHLEKILPKESHILFNQKPKNKLEFIKTHQDKSKRIMMLGDGLNDAGALMQSNVGIAISENINVFSPACDGILDADHFNKLPSFINLARRTISIIKISFVISFLYNIIGLLFAITGNLSPIVAAILMPISSISVVIYVTLSTNIIAKKMLYLS